MFGHSVSGSTASSVGMEVSNLEGRSSLTNELDESGCRLRQNVEHVLHLVGRTLALGDLTFKDLQHPLREQVEKVGQEHIRRLHFDAERSKRRTPEVSEVAGHDDLSMTRNRCRRDMSIFGIIRHRDDKLSVSWDCGLWKVQDHLLDQVRSLQLGRCAVLDQIAAQFREDVVGPAHLE